jgi:hypothetical protein
MSMGQMIENALSTAIAVGIIFLAIMAFRSEKVQTILKRKPRLMCGLGFAALLVFFVIILL